MWRSTVPEPIPLPTGSSFQQIPAPSTGCSDPVKLQSDPNLAAACSCQAATNSVIGLVNAYVGQVEQFNADLRVYKELDKKKEEYDNCLKGTCQGAYAQYQSQYDELLDELRGQIKCFTDRNRTISDTYCSNDHGPGWVWKETPPPPSSKPNPPCTTNCKACDTNTQYRGYCKRSSTLLSSDWKRKLNSQVTVPIVPDPPQEPPFDAQVAIACCSQNFSNIEGDTVKIYDITQECSAQVNKYITDVNNNTLPPGTLPPNPAGSFPVDGEEPAPAGLQTFAIVLIIVAVLVFIAMMIWVGIRLRKRNAAKTASASSTAGTP